MVSWIQSTEDGSPISAAVRLPAQPEGIRFPRALDGDRRTDFPFLRFG